MFLYVCYFGTGNVATDYVQTVIKEDNLRIIGVLDRVRLYGQFQGIDIVNWDEIAMNQADGIIIATSTQFIKEIYFRILPYALARGLKIYSMSLQDLSTIFGYVSNARPVDLTDESIKKLIDESQVVSFDIFDTLLMRKVLYPIDVFKLVEKEAKQKNLIIKDFHKIRREAELSVIGQNLEAIYQKLQELLQLSDEECRLLQHIELECEKNLLTPRPYVQKLYHYCLEANKTIVITSDMYLSQEILATLLEEKGYQHFEKIYVSCDYGMAKSQGLIKKVLQDYPNQKVVHIGDDYEADIKSSQRFNVETIFLPKALDIAMQTPFNKVITQARTLTDSRYLGEVIYQLFNHPLKNEFAITKLVQFTYLFFIPIVFQYLQLINQLIKQKKYESILFIARDGYFFYKVYEYLRQQQLIDGPCGKYIYGSRKLSIRLGMNDEQEIQRILAKYNIEPESAAANHFFGIPATNANFYEAVLKQANQLKKNYKAYLEKEFIDIEKEYLYCELNGQGTGFHYLKSCIFSQSESLYFLRMYVDKVFDVADSPNALISVFPNMYFSLSPQTVFLENIFTTEHPSIIGVTELGEPIYAQENRPQWQIDYMKKIQTILFNQFIEFYQVHVEGELSNELMLPLLECMDEIKFCDETQSMKHLFLYEDLLNESAKL